MRGDTAEGAILHFYDTFGKLSMITLRMSRQFQVQEIQSSYTINVPARGVRTLHSHAYLPTATTCYAESTRLLRPLVSLKHSTAERSDHGVD